MTGKEQEKGQGKATDKLLTTAAGIPVDDNQTSTGMPASADRRFSRITTFLRSWPTSIESAFRSASFTPRLQAHSGRSR